MPRCLSLNICDLDFPTSRGLDVADRMITDGIFTVAQRA
jgi:hypothetical protein